MAQFYEYVATSKIEVPPGSGIVAYAEGQRVPAEAVENLGIQDLVERVGDRSAEQDTSPQSAPEEPSSQSSSEES